MVRLLGWLLLGAAYLGSLSGAVLSRPFERWTAPRELVVLGDPFRFDDPARVSFEGWTVERRADGEVYVRRGAHEESVGPLLEEVVARSDEAGTFVDVDPHPHHPCGHSQGPRMNRRALSLLVGVGSLLALGAIRTAASRRLRRRRLARPQSSPTYRATGRPTGEDLYLWCAIERDARAACAAGLGASLLVTTWALVFVGVL